MKIYRRIFLVLSVIFLLASRFLLLDRSARFIWDESDDLVRMHEIFIHHKLTLIGPVSGTTKIFGSLTYYMQLPFAILFKFDPIGPVIATALYSCAALLLLSYILHKAARWNYALALCFLTTLFPYTQAGRWAWNPYLIPFWQICALTLYFLWKKPKPWYVFTAIGFLQGMGIHNHWYAFFSIVGFGGYVFLAEKNRYKSVGFFILGVIVSCIPFLIFDLTHPPGLFITRFLDYSPLSLEQGGFNIQNSLAKFFSLPYKFVHYFFQNTFISVVWSVGTLVFIVRQVIFKNWSRIYFLVPVFAQILGLSFIGTEVNDYYLLPAVVFFVLFLSWPDKKKKRNILQITLLITLAIFSGFASIREILKNDWSTNIKRTRQIAALMADNMNGKQCNIFVAVSPDFGIDGKKFRDLLILQNKPIMDKFSYKTNNCLFVVSTSDVYTIQHSQGYELDRFRTISPVHTWKIPDEPWYLYQFVLN